MPAVATQRMAVAHPSKLADTVCGDGQDYDRVTEQVGERTGVTSPSLAEPPAWVLTAGVAAGVRKVSGYDTLRPAASDASSARPVCSVLLPSSCACS